MPIGIQRKANIAPMIRRCDGDVQGDITAEPILRCDFTEIQSSAISP